MSARLLSLLKALPLLLLSPILTLLSGIGLGLVDLAFHLLGRRRTRTPEKPLSRSASVVIPSWNGRDLLSQYLPSVVAALEDFPDSEIIVVDNGSTDGSADFVRGEFPHVRVLGLETNLGFGGGSNAGIRAARNDIAVLLNNDMRVESDFLAPLLEGFTDETVFSVSCQIFFRDPNRVREETGLTQAWWENGGLRVRHRLDDAITDLYPCFYGGGGSCAYDRNKFLELGGFDELLAPFYLEDTDIGYMAWKRGWKVYYQPRSVVHHEHRGTIGKRFTNEQIQAVLKKNFLLFTWKNIHEWRRLASHLFHTWADAIVSLLFGDSPERANLGGLWRAFIQLPVAMRARWRALRLAVIDDTEAFRRPLAGYFRDRFATLPPAPEPLRVLFVSPYPIYPPIHGGGVFMYQTATQLASLTELHLIALLDYSHELPAHEKIRDRFASAEFLARVEKRQKAFGSIEPHAVREFHSQDIEWLIHRQIYARRIDVVQLEYTVMAQYAAGFQRIPAIVFEHDIYFQSIGRALPNMSGLIKRMQATFEYLRALRFEMRTLPKADRVQVCHRENREYLESYLPELKGRIDDGLRAGIDTTHYPFCPDGREPYTMLFLGSFRHLPNQEALTWFMRFVLPRVRERCPQARLMVIGSEAPQRHVLPEAGDAVQLVGFVEDVRDPLRQYALFVCPILSGSGVRVKLLEAFAAGIPVVSTRLGAEGLATKDGEICALADDPESFAMKIVELLATPQKGRDMALRARADVVANRDMAAITARLVESYRAEIRRKRGAARDAPRVSQPFVL